VGKRTEVQIHHDVPRGLAVVDGAAQAQNLTGEHPPDAADGVAALVVGGDGNVDELGRRVGIAQGDDGDVDVAGLLDGLGIGARVRDDNQARLLERAGDVVGEGAGGEAAGDGLGARVGGELEDGTLAVGTSRDDANVRGVVDGDDDARGENDLLPEAAVSSGSWFEEAIGRSAQGRDSRRLRRRGEAACKRHIPGLANVEDIDAVGTGLPEVRVHVNLEILGADVALSCEEQLNVLARRIENGGQICGRHLDRSDLRRRRKELSKDVVLGLQSLDICGR